MKYRKLDHRNYLLRLAKGDEVVASLKKLMENEKITACWFTGLGAVSNANLAYYDVERKAYVNKQFDEVMEVASLTGNGSFYKGKPFIHMHMVLGDRGMKAYAGHVNSAIVAGTLELHLARFETTLSRKESAETGLKALDV